MWIPIESLWLIILYVSNWLTLTILLLSFLPADFPPGITFCQWYFTQWFKSLNYWCRFILPLKRVSKKSTWGTYWIPFSTSVLVEHLHKLNITLTQFILPKRRNGVPFWRNIEGNIVVTKFSGLVATPSLKFQTPIIFWKVVVCFISNRKIKLGVIFTNNMSIFIILITIIRKKYIWFKYLSNWFMWQSCWFLKFAKPRSSTNNVSV